MGVGNSGEVQGRFCKKVLSATNGAAESELGSKSRRGKIVSSVAKYWAKVKQSGKEEPVRQCDEWQVGQPRCGVAEGD
jgi:hypothetical protein